MQNIIQSESISIQEAHENTNARFFTLNKLTSKVKPNDLFVDYSYQRETIPAKVNSIAKNFNSKAVGVIVLSIRENGELFVIDGAHRVAALKKIGLGDEDVNSIVYFGLTIQQEAELFVLLNDNRTKPKRSALHKASAKAGDKDAAEIDKMLNRLGLEIGDKPGDRIVRAIGKIYTLNNKVGVDLLEKSFLTLIDAYGTYSSTFQADILTAVSVIYVKCDNVNQQRLAKAMTKLGGVDQILSKANYMADGKAFQRVLKAALMIAEQYNYALRSNRLDLSAMHSATYKDYLNG